MNKDLIDKINTIIDEKIILIKSEMQDYRNKNKKNRKKRQFQEGLNIFYIQIINLKFIKRFFNCERILESGEVFSNLNLLTKVLANSSIITDEELATIYVYLCEINYSSYMKDKCIRIIPEMALEDGKFLCKGSYKDILKLSHIINYEEELKKEDNITNPIINKIPELMNKYNDFYSNIAVSIMYCSNFLAKFHFNIYEIDNQTALSELVDCMESTYLLDKQFISRVISYTYQNIKINDTKAFIPRKSIITSKKSCT